jgi:hypothetical protein
MADFPGSVWAGYEFIDTVTPWTAEKCHGYRDEIVAVEEFLIDTDRTKNTVFAGPASDPAAPAAFRALAAADLPAATMTVQGAAELATDAEVQAGSDTGRIVTPAGLRSDVPATPAASRGVRLNASGDLLLPSGGDVLVEGDTDVDCGIGSLLARLLGDLTKYATVVSGSGLLSESLGWYAKGDGSWPDWCLGAASGTYQGSDDFIQDNYTPSGTAQWGVVGSATPYAVTVADHRLLLQAKKSSDGDASHAAIGAAIDASTGAFVQARLARLHVPYYQYISTALDCCCGVGVWNAGLTEGFMCFLVVPESISDDTVAFDATMYWQRYYHASTAWDPAVTDATAWTGGNWTTLISKPLPLVMPMNLAIYPDTAGHLNFALGLGGSQYTMYDRVSTTVNGPFTKVVLFHSYFPATATRGHCSWDFVKVINYS